MNTPQPVVRLYANSAVQRAYLSELIKFAGYGLCADKNLPVDDEQPWAIISTSLEPLNALINTASRDEKNVLGPLILFAPPGTQIKDNISGIHVIHTPVKASEAIVRIQKLMKSAKADRPFKIGGNLFDYEQFLLTKENGEEIRLTEKEAAILLCLSQQKNTAATREQLLSNIWAYVQGVETHTLETHIYRLRQKLEENPSQPQWLITTEDGYMLRG